MSGSLPDRDKQTDRQDSLQEASCMLLHDNQASTCCKQPLLWRDHLPHCPKKTSLWFQPKMGIWFSLKINQWLLEKQRCIFFDQHAACTCPKELGKRERIQNRETQREEHQQQQLHKNKICITCCCLLCIVKHAKITTSTEYSPIPLRPTPIKKNQPHVIDLADFSLIFPTTTTITTKKLQTILTSSTPNMTSQTLTK